MRNTEQLPDLRGVDRLVTSPNVEADVLEEVMGLRFKEKPRKVVLTTANYLRLMQNKYFGLKPHLELANVLADITTGLVDLQINGKKFIGKSAKGIYHHETNTYFLLDTDLPSEENRRTGFHENTHAFVYQQNPQIMETLLALAAKSGIFKDSKPDDNLKALEYYHKPEKLTPTDDEMFRVLKIFDEGIAEWVEFETEARLQNKDSRAFHEYWLRHKQTRNLVYRLGHAWMLVAMREMNRSVATAEGLNLLIKDPPSTYADFSSPDEYARIILRNAKR